MTAPRKWKCWAIVYPGTPDTIHANTYFDTEVKAWNVAVNGGLDRMYAEDIRDAKAQGVRVIKVEITEVYQKEWME